MLNNIIIIAPHQLWIATAIRNWGGAIIIPKRRRAIMS